MPSKRREGPMPVPSSGPQGQGSQLASRPAQGSSSSAQQQGQLEPPRVLDEAELEQLLRQPIPTEFPADPAAEDFPRYVGWRRCLGDPYRIDDIGHLVYIQEQYQQLRTAMIQIEGLRRRQQPPLGEEDREEGRRLAALENQLREQLGLPSTGTSS
ncbi:hypothetical protein MMC22_010366 [Lobaria immixta]|nr:hypothetical protein [Lobaria immixta]